MKVKALFKPATVLVIVTSAGSWQWAIASDQMINQPGEGYLTKGLFDSISLWTLFLLTVVLVMVSVWLGRLGGMKHAKKTEGAVGAVVGAVLSLLAFLLAFTFNIASNRFDARKQVLLDEVESIGTTYLRAGLLSEPQGGQIRQHLREYVDVRLVEEGTHQPVNLVAVHARTMQLHGEMWSKATALVAAGHKSEIDALFIDSLNQTINLHNRRAATIFLYRVPDMVWITLMLASMISMTMVGYLFGITNSGDWLLSLALALIFSAVITLTSALDRPIVRVNQGPMIELQKSIQAFEQPPDGNVTSRSGM